MSKKLSQDIQPHIELLPQCFSIICIVVSNIEAIQSQLKNIYTNTLSTLCPLPWLEKSEDVQYKFDDVFIPLRTTNIDIQQSTRDVHGPSGSSSRSTRDVPGSSGSSSRSTRDVPGPSGSSSRSTGIMENRHTVRYINNKFIEFSKIMK